MNVRVLFFGPLADITGTSALAMETSDEATVASVVTEVMDRWPALRQWDASLLTAVNLEWARRNDRVPPDAELAIMPPVQGG